MVKVNDTINDIISISLEKFGNDTLVFLKKPLIIGRMVDFFGNFRIYFSRLT